MNWKIRYTRRAYKDKNGNYTAGSVKLACRGTTFDDTELPASAHEIMRVFTLERVAFLLPGEKLTVICRADQPDPDTGYSTEMTLDDSAVCCWYDDKGIHMNARYYTVRDDGMEFHIEIQADEI